LKNNSDAYQYNDGQNCIQEILLPEYQCLSSKIID
jgi:hypothetical protein